MNVSITVLVENTAVGQGLLAEHGLACRIEYGSQRVPFDTGQGLILASNAYRLGVPLFEMQIRPGVNDPGTIKLTPDHK